MVSKGARLGGAGLVRGVLGTGSLRSGISVEEDPEEFAGDGASWDPSMGVTEASVGAPAAVMASGRDVE